MARKSREHGRRLTWSITIWVRDPNRHPQQWAGLLGFSNGQRWPFRSLAELDHLLYELGGWIDPPPREADHSKAQSQTPGA